MKKLTDLEFKEGKRQCVKCAAIHPFQRMKKVKNAEGREEWVCRTDQRSKAIVCVKEDDMHRV